MKENTFYVIENWSIVGYTFICKFPSKSEDLSESYSIFLNERIKKPVRMYNSLVNGLEKFTTYELALEELGKRHIKRGQDILKDLKK